MATATEPFINISTDPVSDRWREVEASTFIENWPKALRDLSIPSHGIPMSDKEAQTLGHSIVKWGETFNEVEYEDAVRNAIIHDLEKAVQKFPAGAFVRLGSRSPKDAFFPSSNYRLVNGTLKTGRDAWNMLTASSEQMSDDLHAAAFNGYQPYIWVREGMDIPKWSEFRCFMRNRTLVGICQYHHSGTFFRIADHAFGIRNSIEEFFRQKFIRYCHLDSVVFDVFVSQREDDFFETRLLEINPFDSTLTSSGMFKWDNIMQVTHGSFRFRNL
jgi:D123